MTDPRGLFAPTAIVDPTATFADDLTQVWHGTRVLQGVRVGKACKVGSGAEIGRGSTLGDRTVVSAGVFLPPNSVVGSRVFIGPNTTFTDDMYPRVHTPGTPPYAALPPVLEDDVNIGAGATVLPGVRIGRAACVAAAAVVTEDVPPEMMAIGVPARIVAKPEGWL